MFPQCEYRISYPNKTETFTHYSNLHLLQYISDFDTIGGKVRYFRKCQNMLQETLAIKADIDVCTIKRLENNQVVPTLETCKKISVALNIPTDFIYDDYLKFIDSDYSLFLKNLRKQLNLTQPQLAKELGLTKKTISFWERKVAFPSPQNYKLLCEYIIKGSP